MAGFSFIYLLQAAHNLCILFVKLKEMGHPKYLHGDFEDELECSIEMSAAAQKVCIHS